MILSELPIGWITLEEVGKHGNIITRNDIYVTLNVQCTSLKWETQYSTGWGRNNEGVDLMNASVKKCGNFLDITTSSFLGRQNLSTWIMECNEIFRKCLRTHCSAAVVSEIIKILNNFLEVFVTEFFKSSQLFPSTFPLKTCSIFLAWDIKHRRYNSVWQQLKFIRNSCATCQLNKKWFMIASSQKGKGEITLPFSAIKYRVKVLLFGSTRRLLYNNINLSRFSRLISRTLLKEPQIICNKTI